MEMPKDLTEVTLRRKDVYDGKILKVHVDDVRLPNGREAVREVVDHVDGAAVLAMDEANRVLVVRQYRYVFGDEFLNVERVPFDEMVHRCMNGEIDDAKTVAAVLRAKDCVMTTVTSTKENCGDILADAKAINEQRAEEAAAAVVEDTSKEEASAE